MNKRLKFWHSLTNICNRVSKKLHTLARISQFMSIHKRRNESFYCFRVIGYWQLLWMFHRRKSNSPMNRLHERALRIIYPDYTSSFTEPFGKDNSTTIHNKDNHLLAMELFKVKNRVFFFFFKFNWDSLHAGLNSHYEAWSYKQRSTKKITGYRKSV